jgi:hypothetical protein
LQSKTHRKVHELYWKESLLTPRNNDINEHNHLLKSIQNFDLENNLQDIYDCPLSFEKLDTDIQYKTQKIHWLEQSRSPQPFDEASSDFEIKLKRFNSHSKEKGPKKLLKRILIKDFHLSLAVPIVRILKNESNPESL